MTDHSDGASGLDLRSKRFRFDSEEIFGSESYPSIMEDFRLKGFVQDLEVNLRVPIPLQVPLPRNIKP